jgi:uncharacterized protein YajQ (UPF0234 family)
MPSFDILSEVDQPALRNAVEQANRKVDGRHDFKGTSAKIELAEKLLTLYGDSDFQLEQIKTILLPEMTKKNVDVRCLDYGDVQKISGNKVKQEVKVRVGVEQELAKKIVKLLKDSKMKVQAAIQGDAVRVSGAKRDVLQEAIALVKKQITDFPCSTATSATECAGQGRNPTGAARRPSCIGTESTGGDGGAGGSRLASLLQERWGSRVPHRGRYAFHRHPARSRGTSGEGIMEASAIAAMASSNALAQVQQEASVEVLRKALDIQGESAMQLLQAIPRPPAPAVGSTAGGIVDTYA